MMDDAPVARVSLALPPFPSCPNYDRKAWSIARERRQGRALFWNVLGASPPTARG